MPFIFHLLGLPHLPTNKDYSCCAYGNKVIGFASMMKNLGHKVYFYGAEKSKVECDEFIQTISEAEQTKLLEKPDPKRIPNLVWDSNEPIWTVSNSRAIADIALRRNKNDFLIVSGGTCQKPVADAFPKDIYTVEALIGYYGTFAKFRVFETYTHHASVCGSAKTYDSVSAGDVVIPPYCDKSVYTYQKQKMGYALFLGRCIKSKGLGTAIVATKAAGVTLVIAGQGIKSWHPEIGRLETEDGQIFTESHIKYVGVADLDNKVKLLQGAGCVIMPTVYMEPGGNVSIESNFCGTPLVSVDHGCFAENVLHGVSGYRCHNLRQFVDGIKACKDLDPQKIRDRAISLWSFERVGMMFNEYFTMISYFNHPEGWSKLDGEANLSWLSRLE